MALWEVTSRASPGVSLRRAATRASARVHQRASSSREESAFTEPNNTQDLNRGAIIGLCAGGDGEHPGNRVQRGAFGWIDT
eukprot:4543125-Prymnesium_polylepis.1